MLFKWEQRLQIESHQFKLVLLTKTSLVNTPSNQFDSFFSLIFTCWHTFKDFFEGHTFFFFINNGIKVQLSERYIRIFFNVFFFSLSTLNESNFSFYLSLVLPGLYFLQFSSSSSSPWLCSHEYVSSRAFEYECFCSIIPCRLSRSGCCDPVESAAAGPGRRRFPVRARHQEPAEAQHCRWATKGQQSR